MKNAFAALLVAVGAWSAPLESAMADTYPSKPVTIIVPFAPGGPTDVVARQLAAAMTVSLGQTVIVENRASSGGIVGSEAVNRAEPDGYTLLIHNIGMSTLPSLSRNLRFDPTTDFAPVGQIVDVPMTLIGRKDFAPGNYRELLAYMTTHQKDTTIANAGIGTASHLCGLLLMSRLGIALTTVPYKGAAPAMNDVMGSQVDLLCDQVTTTTQPILAQRVKAYGSTTRERLARLPDVPTLGEQGLIGFEVSVWHGLYAPKRTPKPVIDRLVQALQAALVDKNFDAAMVKLGAVPVSAEKATPLGLSTHLTSEIAKWSPIIQQAQAYID